MKMDLKKYVHEPIYTISFLLSECLQEAVFLIIKLFFTRRTHIFLSNVSKIVLFLWKNFHNI